MTVRCLDTVASTQAEARAWARAGAAHGDAVVARRQTAGRGRRGRTWAMPADAGLLLTVVWRLPAGPPPAGLAVVAGVGVRAGLLRLAPHLPVTLKWPNDLWVGGRKLAGILLEAEDLGGAHPFVLVGVGLNCGAAADLPDPVRDTAVGLADLGASVTPHAVLPHVLAGLHDAHDAWQRHGLAPAREVWQAADALMGRRVRAEGPHGPVTGTAAGLRPDGALRVLTARGEVGVGAGEVTRVRPVGALALPVGSPLAERV